MVVPSNLVYVGTYTRSGRSQGIQVFQWDPSSGKLTFLHTDPAGRFVLVANHEHGSVVVLPVDADGRLGPVAHFQQHEGSGPGPTQAGPHAHWVDFDLPGRRVLVADKGIDKIVIYRLDIDSGKLVPNDPPFGTLHRGA